MPNNECPSSLLHRQPASREARRELLPYLRLLHVLTLTCPALLPSVVTAAINVVLRSYLFQNLSSPSTTFIYLPYFSLASRLLASRPYICTFEYSTCTLSFSLAFLLYGFEIAFCTTVLQYYNYSARVALPSSYLCSSS